MKKMMRRILGSALALAMTAGLLSGCGRAHGPGAGSRQCL